MTTKAKAKLKGDGQKLTKVPKRNEPKVGNRGRSARVIARAAGKELLGALLERLRSRFEKGAAIGGADLYHELNACEAELCGDGTRHVFEQLRDRYPVHVLIAPGALHEELSAFEK